MVRKYNYHQQEYILYGFFKKFKLVNLNITDYKKLKNRIKPARNKGKIAIYKLDEIKYINECDINEFLTNGWIRGVPKFTEEHKNKISLARLKKYNTGYGNR